MIPMKIYVCGKVTGERHYKRKFRAEEKRLKGLGYNPYNPAAWIHEDEEWQTAMKLALTEMLCCEGVSLLPNWKQSKGAKIEERLARELGLDVRESKDWQG